MFIIRSHPKDKPILRGYIQEMTEYVTKELRPPIVYVVDTVKEMFDDLRLATSGGKRVGRIRIVGHGGRGRSLGTVQMHYPGPAGLEEVWVTPQDVMRFARDPSYQAVIRDVMAPDAVVEFWGCNLGAVPPGTPAGREAGTAWATLFQAQFKATPVTFWQQQIAPSVIPIPARRGESGLDAQSFAKNWSYPRLPPIAEAGGSWARGKFRPARSTHEVRAAGPLYVEVMRALLFIAYQQLVEQGEIEPITGSPEVQEAHMEKIFDRTGGQIRAVVIKKGEEAIFPSEWRGRQLWNTFSPIPFKDLVTGRAPAETKPKAPPAPPRPRPAPARPPTHAAGPPTAPPARPQPAPRAEEAPSPGPAPAPAPAAPPEAPAPPARRVEERRTPAAPPPTTPQPAAPRPIPAPPAKRPHLPALPSSAGEVDLESLYHYRMWNFGVGSAALLPAHRERLRTVARDFMPIVGAKFQFEGHASRTGSRARNQELSELRAKSAENFLASLGVDHSRITVRALGDTDPWDPDAPAGEIGHDRRVDVRIFGPATVPERRPLPQPQLEPPIQWHEKGPKPDDLAHALPGYSIEGKLSKDLPSIPFGPDWLLMPEIEVGLKLQFTTAVPIIAANSLKDGSLDYQIKVEVAKDLAVTPSLGEGKVAVQYKGLPMYPELELGIKKLLADPNVLRAIIEEPKKLIKIASLKFTVHQFKWPDDPLDFGRRIPQLKGVGVQLILTPKVIISIGPSPGLVLRLTTSLAARLGPTAGIIGGAVVGAAALTVLAMYLIGRAHQQGERWAEVVNLREGYSRRLAAEASDWRGSEPGDENKDPQMRRRATNRGWEWAVNENLKQRYRSGTPRTELERAGKLISERGYSQLYDGWQAADKALSLLPLAQYNAAMQALRERHGTDVETLSRIIFERIGGIDKDRIALPQDPTLLT